MSAAVADVLSELARLDVKLWVEDGRLRVNAPQGALTPELKASLSARKQEFIDFLAQGAAAPAQVALVPRGTDEAPLTHGQERILALARLEGASSVYNVPTVFHLAGALDIPSLERAIGAVVQRHDSLRTVFPDMGDRPAVQKVLPPQPVGLPVLDAGRDLAKLPPQQALRALHQLLQREARKPFDLQKGPLWRVRLLRLKPQEHVLAFTMHHIVFDGVSKAIFLDELAAAYQAACTGGAQAPRPELQFGDYAAWQRATLDDAALQRQLAFWREQLAGDIAPLALPNDKPRKPGKGAAASVQFALPPPLGEALQELARREKVPLFAVLMAGFHLLLHGYTGQSEQLVVSPMASRDRAEVERMVGYFNNIVVMRADLSGNPSFRELLAQLRRRALEAFDNQYLPLQQVAQLPNLVRTPLTLGMFSFQDASSRKLALQGLRTRPINVRKDAADFDLALYTELEDGRITGVLDVNADLFGAERVKRLIQRYLQVLEAAAGDPQRRVADFPSYGRPLSEIEALLAKHPQIDQAVVQADARTGQLNAWLVLNEHDVPSLDAIREYAAKQLPDYRVPAAFVPVDEMPLAADGSIDRSALPAPGGGRSRLGTEYRAPRTPLEQQLCGIWQRVLWLDHDVGIDDRFRELGGHSLLSVQMVVEIEKALGRTVPARALAKLNTVAELAEAMERPETEIAANASEVLPDDIYHGLRSHTASWEGKRTSPDAVMVGLNTDGPKQAIFWCLQRHQELQQLARYLGPEQPVWGMRSGNRVMVKSQENIELLAAHYVGEILAAQPQGPYIVGGNCQAALIAFQIARQLREKGHQITLLVMQEKFAPFPYDSPVALLFGDRSVYNPRLYYREPQRGWHKYYRGPVVFQQIQGEHGQFFREPNVQVLTAAIKKFVEAAQAGTLKDDPARMVSDAQLLPAGSQRAGLSVDGAPAQAATGEALTLTVRVENQGGVDWRPSEASGVFVGGRWLDAQGRVHRWTEARAALPDGLAAGAATRVELAVRAPAEPGAWKLEIDLVDEGVAWFQEMGSTPRQIELNVV